MKKSGFVIMAFVLFAAMGMFPSLSTAGGVQNGDMVIAVPEELGGGYLITEEQAIAAGLVIPVAPEAATPHTLTVIVTGTAGAIKSSPKGIDTCVHTGEITPTTCASTFTAKGITLHAYASPVTSTATAILDWSGTGIDTAKRCKHESPTCAFNLTSDMTVTATFGVDPKATVTPVTTLAKPYKFGNVKKSKTATPASKTATFTVKNPGVTKLTITGIAASDSHYTIPATIDGKAANKCITAPVDPKKNCTFKVVYTPTANTTDVSTITITSDDAAPTVYVTGTGTGF